MSKLDQFPQPNNNPEKEKIKSKEILGDALILRKGDRVLETDDSCKYPLPMGGKDVPKNLVPVPSLDADVILQRNGFVVVTKDGELHPKFREIAQAEVEALDSLG